MDFNVLAILFMTIIAPLWIIFHYGSKKRDDRKLTVEDERMLEDLWRSAKEIERRLGALESIVEPDAPKTSADRPSDRPIDRSV